MNSGMEVSPAAVGAANGALVAQDSVSPWPTQRNAASPKSASMKLRVVYRVTPDGEPVMVVGREAQTLALLVARGPEGFTSGEASPLGWGRRTSAYVHDLRRLGLRIETTYETTSDGARIGRYRLSSPVQIVEVVA
jgi:hypothetical protein